MGVLIIQLFARNNIIVYALLSHTSGKIQPLDVVSFSAFKGDLSTLDEDCIGLREDRPFDLADFCSLHNDDYSKEFTSEKICDRFRRFGMWPVDLSRLLSQSQPATNTADEPNVTVRELVVAIENKGKEISFRISGSDAEVASVPAFTRRVRSIRKRREAAQLRLGNRSGVI